MGELILVTGAARSGKSTFAEKLAASFGKEVIYLATAQALDTEMEQRIAHHKLSRPSGWTTVEEPLDIPGTVRTLVNQKKVILLDCVTLWLTNLLLQELDKQQGEEVNPEPEILAKVRELVDVVHQGECTLICVSNEVGWGVVPDNRLGRVYRDLAGRANQALGRAASKIYLVTAGYPMEIKQQGCKLLQELEG